VKKIIKIREGESIPEGAKYLSTGQEKKPTHQQWRSSRGIMGLIGYETLYQYYEIENYHFYEVETNNE
jgi:hypothetical protein